MPVSFRCHGLEVTVDPCSHKVTYTVVDINDARLTPDCMNQIKQIMQGGCQ